MTFNRSIADCGWTATINASNYFGPLGGWGTILAENDGNPFTTGPPNVLRVRLQHTGQGAGEVPYHLGDPNSTFSVSVDC